MTRPYVSPTRQRGLSGGAFLGHGLEEWAEGGRQLIWSGRAVGPAFPEVTAQAMEDAVGDGQGVSAIRSTDPRDGAAPHAVDKVLQFAGELVLGMAVDVGDLQVGAEQVFLEAGTGGRIETVDVEAVPAPVGRRLHQAQAPPREVEARIAFRRPDVHTADGGRTGTAGGQAGHAAVG